MSLRIAKKPISIPSGVEIKVQGLAVTVKGPKGEIAYQNHPHVSLVVENDTLLVKPNVADAKAMLGTACAIVTNHIEGVTKGFSKKLQLVGVGYRAQVAKGKDGRAVLNLTLGLSHPVSFLAPAGIEIVAPSVTEIEVSGLDKQLVGQAAADIRGICKGVRKPEPYKGKGIRYADERIILKETKKK